VKEQHITSYVMWCYQRC